MFMRNFCESTQFQLFHFQMWWHKLRNQHINIQANITIWNNSIKKFVLMVFSSNKQRRKFFRLWFEREKLGEKYLHSVIPYSVIPYKREKNYPFWWFLTKRRKIIHFGDTTQLNKILSDNFLLWFRTITIKLEKTSKSRCLDNTMKH